MYLLHLGFSSCKFIILLSVVLCDITFSYAVDLEGYTSEIRKLQNESLKSSHKYNEEAFQLQKDSISKSAENVQKVVEILGIDLPVNEGAKEGNAVNIEGLEKYVFISLSIPEKGLIELVKQAKVLGFIPVLRGFKDGSYIKTQEALNKVIKETDYGVVIDPELFKEFEIKVVPSIVITRSEDQFCAQGMSCPQRRYNKLSGNVTLDYALLTLLKKGEAL